MLDHFGSFSFNGAPAVQPVGHHHLQQSVSAQGLAGPSAGPRGPTARDHVIPGRPKPGRKPANDEPANKRTEQNRMAQRAFRERQKKHVNGIGLQRDELIKARKVLEVENASMSAQLSAALNANRRLELFARGCHCQTPWHMNEQT
jgi:hypothetical protein